MIRTQIQLTEDQMHKLKNIANRRRVSVAELIRESVDQFLRSPNKMTKEDRIKRASEVIGKYHSGKHDISVKHDDYLDESYES